jgi:CheY-like chemotaxis protein
MTLVEAVFAPRARVEEVVHSLEPIAAAKGLTIETHLAGLPALLRGDEGKVRQILLNLLSNAVKFTEAGTISVHATGLDQAWSLAVTDTGRGIAAEHQQLIFEEFRQVDASSTRQAGGTGLGLAISRKMAELMGGTLAVASRPGEGSTFTLALPLVDARDPAAARAGETSVAAVRPGGKLLLAIDDDPDILDLMVNRLATSEFSVVAALGGEAGINLAHKLKPDLITLDILMPVLDGWEVLRRLKASPETRHIPVIMLSIVENRALSFGLEAAESLVKPVSREALLEVLRRHSTSSAPVLIVDDEVDARALVAEVLSGAGIPSLEAANGEEALAAIARQRPSLVVLDLMMPGMDGFAVLEHLAADDDLRNLPVIVLTALTLTPADEARLKQGARLVLDKAAIEPDKLLAQLRQVLGARFAP